MRVIRGELRGRKFPDDIPSGTRPTTDFNRENLLNILSNIIDFDDIRAVDFFSGTGAFGIEMISSGAIKALFVDKNRKAVEYITKTLDLFKVEKERYETVCHDVMKFTAKENPAEPYNLVFADPPYKLVVHEQLIDNLLRNGFVQSGSIIIIELGQTLGLRPRDEIKILTEKNYGITKIFIAEVL